MDFEKLRREIVNWLRNKTSEAGATGGVVGLSGGLDSAVVSLLCKEAFLENFQPLILPCESSSEDLEDAHLVEKFLGVEARVIDLTPIFHLLCSVLPQGTEKGTANLKPRLRMITLYYFANSYNKLVVGTGNKSELMLGYFTKYGDGGVDLLPLGDLYKTEVREFAKSLGVPERILKKPPSAGLWEGQTDEGEIGLSYEEIDSILRALEGEKGYRMSDFPEEKVEKVKRMVKLSVHKREMPSIFKVSPRPVKNI
jgi:NAD+ synthase